MRLIFTGGGTGGHIYPALAIADRFREADPESEILYIGYKKGMECEIVPRHGYELKTVRAKGVDRSNIFKMADTLLNTEIGTLEAAKIIRRFQPDVIVSTGGYVSVPVVLAGHRYGAKVFIHEQNAFPGMANKFLAKYAERVYLGFREAGAYFKDGTKLEYSGNPTRKEFRGISREEARTKLSLPQEGFVVSVFGGSLGARALNEVGCTLIREFRNEDHVTILFGTGRNYYEEVKEQLAATGADALDNVRVTPYIDDMANVLAASNVIISRSGALSVAEITMSGRPAIFIPSPNVTGDHQYYNAKSVADAGGGIIVREDADMPDRVLNTLRALIADPDTVQGMEEASLGCAPVHAVDTIYEGIMEICRE